MDISKELWQNWLRERSILSRYPSLIYLSMFMLGSLLWRLGSVRWAWNSRELRVLPYGLIFSMIALYILRPLWWRCWMIIRAKPGHLLLLGGLMVFGFTYTACRWERTELLLSGGSALLEEAESIQQQGDSTENWEGTQYFQDELQVLGQVIAMEGQGEDENWTIRPQALYAPDLGQSLPDLRGKVEVRQPIPVSSGQMQKHGILDQIQIGDCVVITGKIQPFQEATNPGQFDYARFQRYQGFIGQMWQPEVALFSRPQLSLLRWFSIGKDAAERFFAQTLGTVHQPLVMALLTGETDYLSDSELEQIRNLGLSHLLAISGLHLGFVVNWFRRLLRWGQIPKKWQPAVLLIALWLAVFFVGARPSALRVGFYLTLAEVGALLKRPLQPLNLLAVTAWLVLLLNPLTLFLLSFQLSFLVYLAIMVFFPPLNQVINAIFPALLQRWTAPLSAAFVLSLAAFAGSLPVVLFQFFQVPVQGILMNLWAVPLTGIFLALILGSLLAGWIWFPLGQMVAGILDHFVRFFRFLVQYFASREPWLWRMGRPLILWIILFYLACWLGWWLYQRWTMPVLWRKRQKRVALGFYFLVLLTGVCTGWSPPGERGLEWVVLDVGQGDGMFLRLPHGETVLIDGGGLLMGEDYVGERILKPFLLSQGIRAIDLVCITHFDADHVRGLIPVLKEFRIGGIWTPERSESQYFVQVMEIAHQRKIPVFHPTRGQKVQLGEVLFEVLHPVEGYHYVKENDRSLVLRLSAQGVSILFTGDLGEQGEREIITSGLELEASFLKVGHHGSKTSSSTLFVREVNPAVAIVSVGKNRYGHPAKETLYRLAEEGSAILRTDQLGAIRVFCRKGQVSLWPFNKNRQTKL